MLVEGVDCEFISLPDMKKILANKKIKKLKNSKTQWTPPVNTKYEYEYKYNTKKKEKGERWCGRGDGGDRDKE